jgi:hypothetical protein
MKKIVLLTFVALLLSPAMIAVFTKPVAAATAIYINQDGSITGTDKIEQNGNVYTFTGNINNSIIIERENIVVDGSGYPFREQEVEME